MSRICSRQSRVIAFDRRAALVHRDVLLNRVDPQLVCEKLDVVVLVVDQDACEVLVDGEVNPVDANFADANSRREDDAVFGNDLRGGLFDRFFGHEFLTGCELKFVAEPFARDPWNCPPSRNRPARWLVFLR